MKTTDELRQMLKDALSLTVQSLLTAAPIYMELLERGADMSDFNTNYLSKFLPDIASGKLKPELVLLYAGAPQILDRVRNLVDEDKEKLAQPNAKVEVLLSNDRVAPLLVTGLSTAQAMQVFGDGRIRSKDEQRPFVPPKPTAKPEPKPTIREADNDDLCWSLDDLTYVQKVALLNFAKSSKTSPGDVIESLLIRNKIIPPRSRREVA